MKPGHDWERWYRALRAANPDAYHAAINGTEARKPRRPFPWGAVLLLAGAICLGYGIGRASASERAWIVWSLDADAPWTSPRGHQATATGPTACSLALHEAAQASPKGARLACRKIDGRK